MVSEPLRFPKHAGQRFGGSVNFALVINCLLKTGL